MGKLIRLDIQGDFDSAFSVTAQILKDSAPFPLIAGEAGKLPRNPNIKEAYRNWQAHYRSIVAPIPKFPLTDRPSFENVSGNIQENDFEPFRRETQDLIANFNNWLKHQDFQSVESLLRTHLEPGEENRILLLTNNPWLRKLPWHEWDLLRDFSQTEVGFSSPNFQQLKQLLASQDKVKILAILGYQADIVSQGQPIQNLGNHVEVTWLKQPKREELDEPLWKQQWDILFFVGHGESQDDWKTGTIWINKNDKITIGELRNHFKKAIDNGLKLAILNCCDGLGLAHSLAEGEDLYLPQIIAMREELPVAVAPRFLQYFMEEFTQGNSLYASVRKARRRLQILEKEFPCVSNLPVICQNPAVKPLRWNDLVIPPNPYQGLSAFQEKDAALFFGRETFTNQLVKVVETKKLVAVIGASGSGKSSVVLAGLIPSLRQQENWLIANLRPESTPFENFAKALLLPVAQLETGENEGVTEVNAEEINQLAIDLQEGNRTLSDVVKSVGSSRRFLLVIDQFEEIYTYPNQKNRQFLDCLLDAVQNFSAFRLVITLRADFLGQAIKYDPFREQLDRWKPEFIGGMVRTELQAAIEEPAKKRNVYLEAGLTEHILNDVGDEQGNLPLLEFALTELWKQQENGLLTRLKYDEIGGVEKALCRHAEGVYDALKEGDKERIKQIFMKLVSPGEGTEYTRQLATRAEVGEENWDLVTHLATARLVVSNRNETTQIETVEIVHEALIKAWPDLRKWIEDNDTFLRWKKRLKVAFMEWERNENKEGYLLQSAPLGEAEGYLLQRLEEISKAERVFINLSLEQEQARQERELQQERQARIAAQKMTGAAIASLLVIIVSGGFAWWQRQQSLRIIQDVSAGIDVGTPQLLSILPDFLKIADGHRNAGDIDRALSYYRKILTEADKLLKSSPNDQENLQSQDRQKLQNIFLKAENSLVETIQKYRLPQLEEQLKNGQIGKLLDNTSLLSYEKQYTEGALRTTYAIMMRELGAKADLNDDGELKTHEEAEHLPCETLKAIDVLWRKYTQNYCGWYDKKSAYQAPQCKKLDGLTLTSKILIIPPYDVAINRLNTCKVVNAPANPNSSNSLIT
ncbi:nSTAND1 domain-containing NTPase [Microcoleus sp. B9-D4]|uniref:nSTAND1 domain-containing NTPase n=1 Tax=Microcoleus sp. B9-D4 TaxID=2818711 RepID=UPI002FD11BF4